MHEMSLAEGVLQLIEEAAVTQGFRRVKTVWLEIGQLASVEIDAMRFCFDAVAAGSILEEAELVIIEVPGEGWCPVCTQTVPVTDLLDCCPRCGGQGVRATGGMEMRVKELEVE